jgi:hypothetical protein
MADNLSKIISNAQRAMLNGVDKSQAIQNAISTEMGSELGDTSALAEQVEKHLAAQASASLSESVPTGGMSSMGDTASGAGLTSSVPTVEKAQEELEQDE